MLTDTHCHLTSSKFDADRDEVIARAIETGVTRMVTIACDLEDSPQCIALAESHPQVFATVGIHPCYVMEIGDDGWLQKLRELAANPRHA